MNDKSGLVCGYTGDTIDLESVTCMHLRYGRQEAVQEDKALDTRLKVKEKTSLGYILENGCIIEDTFADTCHHIVMVHSVLGKPPFFS